MFNIKEVLELVEADSELVPGDDQVVLGVDFKPLDPLVHAGELLGSLDVEGRVPAVWV